MTHAPRIALATLAVIAGVSCLPPEPAPTPRATPLIGRIQFQDRVVDLDVNAFADSPGAVPPSSYARVIADVDEQHSGKRDADDAKRPEHLRR